MKSGGQKEVGQHIQSAKRKANKQTKYNCQPRILYLAKLPFKSEGDEDTESGKGKLG